MIDKASGGCIVLKKEQNEIAVGSIYICMRNKKQNNDREVFAFDY